MDGTTMAKTQRHHHPHPHRGCLHTLYRVICAIGLALLAITTSQAQAHAQTPTPRAPDCNIAFTLTAAAASNPYDNRQQGCTNWVITYTSSGFTVLSLAFQSSADTNGTPTAWGSFAGTVVTGINPNTAITQATSTFTGYYPWLRVNLSGLTGTGTVRGLAYGWKTQSAQVGGSPPTGVAGGCLSGTYPNPGIAGVTTAGGVLFANSTPCATIDTSKLFLDPITGNLGVGTNSPATVASYKVVDINGTSGGLVALKQAGTVYGQLYANSGSLNLSTPSNVPVIFLSNGSERGRFAITSGNFLLGTQTDRNYRFLVNSSGSTGTESLVDTTATTGFTLVDIGWDGTNTSALTTRVRVRAGAVQGAVNLQEWTNNTGTVLAAINASGFLQIIQASTSVNGIRIGNGLVKGGSNVRFAWGSSTENDATDTALARNGAGIVEFNNGTVGTFRDALARNFYLGGTTSATPSIRFSGAGVEFKLGDNSAFTTVRASNYISNDGSAGVTGATCTAWKNGLCTTL